MNSIEKISFIDRSKLNEKFYFQSLLEEAYRCNLLCEAEIKKIQFECLELLAYKVERYNQGDSSSIRIEDAENIMISNLYTIGIWLKSFQSVDDAIKELKGTKIRDIYNYGRNKIDTLLRSTNHIHKMVIQNMIHTENHTYSSTVIDGIKGFFKLYNPDFEAQEIHITADYPLCNQVENLAGIEFIQKYLECIYYENVFCSHFSTDNIHHMLCGYDIGYKDLVINIFEQVLTTAIGCNLAGIDAVNLNISEDQINILYDLLYNKSKEDIEEIILKANENLQEELSINSIPLKQYMKKSLSSIISVVCHAVKANTLEKVFIAQKYPELNPKLNFSFGDKMDDKLYRITIEEIMQCRFLSDKISIIKNSIHSLADLEELFFDAELSVDEITEVFKELELIELSALAKHHPFKPDIEAVYLSEAEQEFRLCLHNFITNLPFAKKNRILNTITMLDDNNKEI